MQPIGSEFVFVNPPSNWNFMNGGGYLTTAKSGSNFTVWRYLVTAHNEGREVLEPVNEPDNPRYVAPVVWAVRYGRLVPIPPDDLLPLLDDSWKS
jgi:hypothetical protein